MIFIGLSMLGFISYKNLPVELLPNVELPSLVVQVSSVLEVDPAYMENQAIIPLEGAIGTLEDIEELMSFAQNRQGIIYVSYAQNANMKYAYLKLQEKIDGIKASLPEEFIVTVLKVDIQQLTNEFMRLQVRGSGGIDRVRNITDEDIIAEFENIDGIAAANVFGGREKSVEIILDPQAYQSYGITPFQIRNAISQNGVDKVYAGRVYDMDKRFFVNITAEYTNINELNEIKIFQNRDIRLKDVAEAYFGVKEETSYSRVNGKDAITLTLVSDNQSNLIDLSHKAQDMIDKLNEKLAYKDIEIVVQSNTAEIMEENIDSIIELALVGGLLAVFVLWIFLKNFRLVLVIGLAIPISIYTAFNFFYAFDISINSLTLVGMALAIGMLLDNSVVVLENIYRQATHQKSFDDAVLIGTKEVWRSIFAATLTTITVFLPFIFSSNYMIKVMGNHIGVSIISTLTVSLFVALLLIPMVTHFFMAKSAHNKSLFEKVSMRNRMIQIYILFLKFSMRNPARTLIGALVLFFATILGSLAISVDTLKEVESKEIELYITMPGGSSLEATDKMVQDVENRLENIEEKEDVVSRIEQEDAILTIVLKEDYKDLHDREMADVKTLIEERVSNIQTAEIGFDQPQSSQRFRGPGGGGGGGGQSASFQRMMGIGTQQERIEIKGQDFEKMQNVAEDIQYYLEELETIRSVRLNVSDNRPEVHMDFDTHLMSEYGIPLTSVASELNSFQTEISSGSNFKQGTESYDIIIKNYTTEEDETKSMSDLKLLEIPDENNVNRELQTLSSIFYSTGMRNINRVNQEKQIELTYQFESDVNESNTLLEVARMEIDEIVASLSFPSGVAVEIIHEESDLDEYYFLIAAAFILIYMILASVFESFTSPFVLMFSIPLAAIGSFASLIITNNSLLNTNTLTGFLILLGVVVNNGIILIDYTNILQKQGYRRSRALMVAGMARVRPILITAITTIIAMMPLAMGESEYVGSIGAPFAITVIGGLTFSTIFTLVFIPTFYSGLSNGIEWFNTLDWKIKVVQILVLGTASYFIYYNVYSFIWQLADLILVLILIPGLTYFLLTSLKQAKSTLIGADEDLHIKIQNLVKVYDRDNRFVREWKSGEKITAHFENTLGQTKFSYWEHLIWQLPLIGFLIYFAFFYLDAPFWSFIIAIILFFLILGVWNSLNASIQRKKVSNFINWILFWILPLANLVIFQYQWDNLAAVIIIGFIWYLALAVYVTSNKLFIEKININRLKGRFSGIRRSFYVFVQSIPVIGKKKTPFRALDAVSINIGNGMFGLLGPNGAGKTTLMRIICGILEQSYGKVWINGIDTNEKREELQGLIGYLPQAFGTYENMTSWEFLNYQAILKNIVDKKDRERRIKKCLKEVNMHEHMHEKIGSFSGGMKQRIGIAQILLHLPKILVVDEPTAGLDPRERIRFRNLLVELSKNRIVIFSTHIIEDISSSCNSMAVLNRGKLRYHGDPQSMTKTAEGHVWQFEVPASEFDVLNEKLLIVHHMRDGDNIRIRCIAGDKPYDSAINVRPNLEDAYLWLIKGDQL